MFGPFVPSRSKQNCRARTANKLRLLLPALLPALLLTSCGRPAHQHASQEGSGRQSYPAPPLSLPDLAGRTVSLDQYRGRVVLLDFWATWCPPCRVSIPAVEKLYSEYSTRGLEVLSIDVDEDVSVVQPFVEQHGLPYPVLLAVNTDIPITYQVRGVPTFYLIDQKGNIVRGWIGFDSSYPEQWRDEIDRLLSTT